MTGIDATGLLVECDGCVLRVPTDAELVALAGAASVPGAVLAPGTEHFVTWLAGRTSSEIAADRIARGREGRTLTPGPDWTLHLAVVADGRPVGMQMLTGSRSWTEDRVVGTASWLLREHQGRGTGSRARAAALELACTHLGARAATSWVLADNHASAAVSERLGYAVVDRHELMENGARYDELVYRIEAADWLGSAVRRRYPAVVTGAALLTAAFGGSC